MVVKLRFEGSIDGLNAFVDVIHQHILPNIVRRGEIRFPMRHFSYFFDERNQIWVSSQHESVDLNARTSALRDLTDGFAQHERV